MYSWMVEKPSLAISPMTSSIVSSKSLQMMFQFCLNMEKNSSVDNRKSPSKSPLLRGPENSLPLRTPSSLSSKSAKRSPFSLLLHLFERQIDWFLSYSQLSSPSQIIALSKQSSVRFLTNLSWKTDLSTYPDGLWSLRSKQLVLMSTGSMKPFLFVSNINQM